MFMFWSLLAGLLLADQDKYVAFSLSSLGLVLIYLYIKTRTHIGRSLKIKQLLFIERDQFFDLQKQALINRDRGKSEYTHKIIREDEEIESDVIRNKEEILSRHKEWRSFYTVLSQRCHSKIKCGSENARPQDPFQLEEIIDDEHKFSQSKSLKEKTVILK